MSELSKVNRVSVNSGQVEPMPSISYDTAFKVALSTGFILYYIVARACTAAETLRDHLNSGCVGGWKCVVFPRCATEDSSWICSYIKQYFIVLFLHLKGV
jgi:hypothetical protein